MCVDDELWLLLKEQNRERAKDNIYEPLPIILNRACISMTCSHLFSSLLTHLLAGYWPSIIISVLKIKVRMCDECRVKKKLSEQKERERKWNSQTTESECSLKTITFEWRWVFIDFSLLSLTIFFFLACHEYNIILVQKLKYKVSLKIHHVCSWYCWLMGDIDFDFD